MKRLLQFSALAAVASMYSVYSTVLLWLAMAGIFLVVGLFLLVCAAIGHGIESLADAVARFFGRGREFNTEGVLWRL